MKRLFFALWPDSKTREYCAQLQALLPKHLPCRLVDPANLHVTLVFLGGVSAEAELKLLDAVEHVQVGKLQIEFDEFAYWRKPQIYCLTGSSYHPNLSKLVGELSQIAANNGIVLDERPYRPHVTLARKAVSTIALDFAPLVWQATRFCLVESCSSPGGVEYRVCQTWNLDGA